MFDDNRVRYLFGQRNLTSVPFWLFVAMERIYSRIAIMFEYLIENVLTGQRYKTRVRIALFISVYP